MTRLLAVLLALMLSVTLSAHDFWVEASQYRPQPGTLVGLRLLVGQDMLGDPVPRETAAIARFVVRRPGAEEAVAGRDGADPAGIVRVAIPGLMAIGYQSHPRSVELTPETFDKYLGEEGLDEITSILARSGRKPGAAHELFSRCAKALLQSGPAKPGEADRPLGLTFEIVALRSPYESSAGEPLSFAVTYEGKPKAQALVVAINRRDPSIRRSGRTDAQGRVTFTFPAPGIWLVKAVHMIPAPPGELADWESFWASTTFDLPPTGSTDHGTR